MFDVKTVPLAYNRCYVVDSHGVRILIDAGPDYEGSWETLQDALGGTLPNLVIVTHGHNDHAGLGARWQDAGVPVALGEDDHHLAMTPRLEDEGEWRVFEDYVRATGAPDEVQREVLDVLRIRQRDASAAARGTGYPPASRSTRWPTGIRMTPYHPGKIDDAWEAISEARMGIINCPGHTPGNVIVASLDEGLLFSGDQLLPDITPTPGIQATAPGEDGAMGRFGSLPAFVDSLEDLRDMRWSRCYPGHGEAFDDVAARIEENLAGIHERTAKVRQVLAEQGGATAYGIAMELYPRAVVRRFWQIVATVQGNLDLLEIEGEVRVDEGRYTLT